jgi:dephospho-CoA kinase
MLRVALTGGIATGKSYCLGQFQKLGAAVIDADLLARDAVARDTPGLRAVVARFGQGMLSEDGTLNRAALARVVFTDSRARGDLEAIIHPEIYQRIREWLANRSRSPTSRCSSSQAIITTTIASSLPPVSHRSRSAA